MTQSDIFQPFLAMMLLTLAVWIHMYVLRLSFLHRHKIDPDTLDTPISGARVLRGKVNFPAFNFQNLFELPVTFYALCLYLYVTQNVDELYVGIAWWFVAFRVLHSIIHCTFNKVTLRFAAYMLSSIGLMVMIVRAAIAAFSGAT